LRESGDHEIGIDLRDLSRGDIGTQLHEHLEPHAEAIGVELLLESWLVAAPQVEVEDTCQLLWSRQRDELAAILQAATLNEPVKHLGRQSRNDVGQVRRVHDAGEQVAAAADFPLGRKVC
jgi:hypothetical protein